MTLRAAPGPDSVDLDRLDPVHAPPDEIADLRARLARQEDEIADLRQQLGVMCSSLSNRQDVLELAASDVAGSERRAYVDMAQRLRRLAERVVPGNARVVVVGKGAEDLARTIGRRADHLSGAFHPNCDRAAIAQLEAAIWAGADYLVVPGTALWWLEHYTGFAAHLDRRYVLAEMDDGAGAIWALRESSAWREVDETLELCSVVHQRRPVILDWHTGGDLAERFAECTVFTPVEDGPTLPYVDASIDVVALAGGDDARVAEARRVAMWAVVDTRGSEAPAPRLAWQCGSSASPGLRASIVVSEGTGGPIQPGFVARLVDTLPSAFQGEILVVADPDVDIPQRLAHDRSPHVPVRAIRNPRGATWSERVRTAVQAASDDSVVFVEANTRPVPGWLPPLLRVLDSSDSVGVACGMLIAPDGRLLQAGGALDEAGMATDVGAGDYFITAPRYSHVRTVDFCSTALLATHREVFLAAGGFRQTRDARRSGVDYCARVRAMGKRTVYQPETLTVVCSDD